MKQGQTEIYLSLEVRLFLVQFNWIGLGWVEIICRLKQKT
jgi:hypothetical protein